MSVLYSTIVIRNPSDFNSLYQIAGDPSIRMNIRLDIQMTFFLPSDVLCLAQFAIVQNRKGCHTQLSACRIVWSYLEDIGLKDFVNSNYEQPITINGISSRSAMPIRRVARDNIQEYVNYTQDYFESICTGKNLEMLNFCIGELVMNVYDHSRSEIGAYIFCQYYPTKRELKFCVSDFGIGIPKKVNEHMENLKHNFRDPVSCLKWAVRENNTTLSRPNNQGLGLFNVNNFVKSNKGKWSVKTVGAELRGDSFNNRYKINSQEYFLGTTIEVTINVDNLEDNYGQYEEEFDWY